MTGRTRTTEATREERMQEISHHQMIAIIEGESSPDANQQEHE